MSKLLMLLGGATTVAALAFRAPTDVARPIRSELSVWDSVYTDSQALRGDSLYKESCAKCHGATLAGTDDGSPLTGSNFLGNWNGLSVGELYDKIRTTMP